MAASAVLTRPTGQDTDDRGLVAGVRAGDDRAFEVLYQRYQPRIAAYVRGMVRDRGRAEDITQEVFIAALRRLREETERDIHFKPWIYEIAKNRCIDAFRRRRCATTEVSFDAQDAIGADEHGRLAGPGATPDSAVEGKVAIDNLCGAFGGLSPVHHDILVLREFDGLSYSEIGDRLGMSRAAVESTLFRARKRLSEEYAELVSGERCLRVQAIVDACGGRAAGLRDQRRMARHIAHCQPCRRYARLSGMDLGDATRPAASVAARIAAFLPLPAFLRRRWGDEDAAGLLSSPGPVSQLSANVATVVDPGVASNWAKAVATAATVAVAGVGAGAAFTDRLPLDRFGPAVTPMTRSAGLDARTVSASRSGRVAAPMSRSGATQLAGDVRLRSGVPGAKPPRTPTVSTTAPGTPPQAGGTPDGRDADSSTSTEPTTGARTPAGGGSGPRSAAPANAVGGVLGAVGAVGRDPVAATHHAAPVAPLVNGVTAPLPQAGATATQAVSTTLESALGVPSPPTGAGDTVTTTVADAASITTSVLSGLGGG